MKKGKLILLSTILLSFSMIFLTSCAELFLGKGYTESPSKIVDKVAVLNNQTTGKTIVLLPMAYPGTVNQYKKVAAFIEEEKEKGYSVFAEGMIYSDVCRKEIKPIPIAKPLSKIDKSKLIKNEKSDEVFRKARKIIGYNFYLSDEVFANKNSNRKRIIPDLNFLGIKGSNCYLVDLTCGEIVREYEKEHGVIKLNDYDLETPLSSYEYNRKKADTNVWKSSKANKLRKELLLKEILSSDLDKILVVCNAENALFLKLDLMKSENGYSLIIK